MRNFGYDEDGKKVPLSDMRIWRRIAGYTRDRLPSFSLAVVLSLAVTGATLAQPWLMQVGIDQFITNGELPTLERISGLSTTALWYLLMVVLVFFLSFLQVVVLEYVGQNIMHSIRQDLFRHILKLDLNFFNNNPTGRLVTRLTNDIQNMYEMFSSVMVTMFNDLLRLIGILIALYLMNVRLALVMSVFVPISLILTILFARLARGRFRAIRQQLVKINSFLSEALSGIAILQLYGRQQRARKDFEELSEGFLQRTLAQIRLFGTFMPITEFLSSAAIALILWYGGGEILQERLTIGELVAFISYMKLFFQPLRELSQKYSIVQSAMASAERIFDLLDTKSAINEPARPVSIENCKGEIQFEGVNFGYQPEQRVIEDLSLKLSPGETVALVGTTGSGKTTLVSLLLRFHDPQTGTISIDGVPVDSLSLRNLRNLVGVVLQDVLILQDTLLANIVLDSGKSRKEVEEILDQTGLRRFVEKLPRGLDTLIGEGGKELSTGEKQLLSFARMLCRNPKVLVLDEATAAIDTESENILEDALAKTFTGRTSLVIAHRLSTIRRADRIVVMNRGEIVEEGSHDALIARNGQYARLVEMDLANGVGATA